MNNIQMTITDLADRVLTSGKITSADKSWLLLAAMSLEHPLSLEEQDLVKQLYNRLQMGLLRVVD